MSSMPEKHFGANAIEHVLREAMPDFECLLDFSEQEAYDSCGNIFPSTRRISMRVQLKDGKTRHASYLFNRPGVCDGSPCKMTSDVTVSNELTAFQELLPAFERLYREAGTERRLAPSSVVLKEGPGAPTLVIEDLESKGFRRFDHPDGMDMRHAQTVLEKLAAFHAASAVYFETRKLPKFHTKPTVDRKLQQELEERNNLMNRKFVESLRNYDLREYQDKIVKQLQLRNFAKNPNEVKECTPNEFTALTHGSCRSSHVMFKYDAFGNIVDAVIADFGKINYGSPVQDLLYFILSSTRIEEKLKSFDFYIKHYHDHLVANLQLLGYSSNVPKLTDLHLAVLNRGSWALSVVSKVLPLVTLEATNRCDLEGCAIDDRETLNSAFSNPRYAKQVQELLPWMENRALLED